MMRIGKVKISNVKEITMTRRKTDETSEYYHNSGHCYVNA